MIIKPQFENLGGVTHVQEDIDSIRTWLFKYTSEYFSCSIRVGMLLQDFEKVTARITREQNQIL